MCILATARSDIYELFCAAHDADTHFLFRTCVDRLAEDGSQTIANMIEETIRWKLMTDLPVRSRAEAIEKLDWYAMRWKIETFHKILKSGCRAENSRLRTAQGITNLIAMFCILSWRIIWLTMLNRCAPPIKPDLVFTDDEIALLDEVMRDRGGPGSTRKTLQRDLIYLARLGGYLNRAGDSPPGNTVMWRGMARLSDIMLGVRIGSKLVGN